MIPPLIEKRLKRSLALHRTVVKRLREQPDLWDIPLQNIDRWTDGNGELPLLYQEWKQILTTMPREYIFKLLVSRSQRAAQLRSSSPFVGMISQDERNRIFGKYNRMYRKKKSME